jgi:hypothetical protein
LIARGEEAREGRSLLNGAGVSDAARADDDRAVLMAITSKRGDILNF